jgi:hypothetical protein
MLDQMAYFKTVTPNEPIFGLFLQSTHERTIFSNNFLESVCFVRNKCLVNEGSIREN